MSFGLRDFSPGLWVAIKDFISAARSEERLVDEDITEFRKAPAGPVSFFCPPAFLAYNDQEDTLRTSSATTGAELDPSHFPSCPVVTNSGWGDPRTYSQCPIDRSKYGKQAQSRCV